MLQLQVTKFGCPKPFWKWLDFQKNQEKRHYSCFTTANIIFCPNKIVFSSSHGNVFRVFWKFSLNYKVHKDASKQFSDHYLTFKSTHTKKHPPGVRVKMPKSVTYIDWLFPTFLWLRIGFSPAKLYFFSINVSTFSTSPNRLLTKFKSYFPKFSLFNAGTFGNSVISQDRAKNYHQT